MLYTLSVYFFAAFLEIAGCFAFWSVFRLQKPVWWLLPGTAFLLAFAWCLTKVDTTFASRAYAAYGGIYIISALVWMWVIEHAKPDKWDIVGAILCLSGAAAIIYGPRS